MAAWLVDLTVVEMVALTAIQRVDMMAGMSVVWMVEWTVVL